MEDKEERNSDSGRGAGLRRRAVFGCGFLAALATALLAFAILTGMTALPDLLKALAIGWIDFLKRTLPKIEFNWSIIGMAALCSLLTLGLGHAFCDSVARATRRRWQWRWTVCGFLGMCALFLVGMAAGGIAHQIGWMAASEEKLVVEDPDSTGFRSAFKQRSIHANSHSILLMEEHNSIRKDAAMESAIRESSVWLNEKREDYHLYVILDEGDPSKCVGMLSFPRVHQPERVWTGVLTAFEDSTSDQIRNKEDLREILEKYHHRLRAL